MAEAHLHDVSNWYALRVKPQHECTVAEQLAAHAIEAYVPLYKSRRRWSDRVKTIQVPLFPGYVFSYFALQDRGKVVGVSSVVSIVGFGGIPCAVSPEEIGIVKRIIAENCPVLPWPLLRVGRRVRVRKGPLSGLEGTLVREKTQCRVVVNMEILQRGVAVDIESDLLEPALDKPERANLCAGALC